VSVVTLEPCAIGDRRIVLGTASESGTTRVRSGACAAGILAFGVWVLAAAAAHASPGTLTSAAELAVVRAAADAGRSPAKEDRDRLLADARKTWAWGSVSGTYGTIDNAGSKQCSPTNGVGVSYLLEGAPDAYAQVIGAHLSGDTSLASQARAHVLDLIDTTGFTGLSGDYNANNQCILDLSLAIPVWIETARPARGHHHLEVRRHRGVPRLAREPGLSEDGVGEPRAPQQLGSGGIARLGCDRELCRGRNRLARGVLADAPHAGARAGGRAARRDAALARREHLGR
jgi:hypothetical protein